MARLEFEEANERQEMAKALSLQAMAAQGQPRAIKEQIKKLEKD